MTDIDTNIEQARITQGQLRLFPVKPSDVCQRIFLNWLSALELYKNGWLSFDPNNEENLDEAQEAELIFLGSLVVAGCDHTMLENILKTLQKPYQYKIDHIYYNWHSQQWCLFPHLNKNKREEIVREWLEELNKGQFLFDWINEVEIENVLEDWIEDLVENEDVDQLLAIEKSSREAITRLQK